MTWCVGVACGWFSECDVVVEYLFTHICAWMCSQIRRNLLMLPESRVNVMANNKSATSPGRRCVGGVKKERICVLDELLRWVKKVREKLTLLTNWTNVYLNSNVSLEHGRSCVAALVLKPEWHWWDNWMWQFGHLCMRRMCGREKKSVDDDESRK